MGLRKSADNGESWERFFSEDIDERVTCLAVSDTHIFAGTADGGVFCLNEESNAWAEVNYGLPSMHIYALFSSEDYLFASTFGGLFVKKFP